MNRTVARWMAVLLLAAGVVLAQGSIEVKWPYTYGVTLILVIVEVLLVLAVLAGVGLERLARHRSTDADGVGERRPNLTLAVVAGLALLVFGALCVRFAVTEQDVACGSPLNPVDYDCKAIDGTAAAFFTGWVALVFGGWTMSALRLRRVRISPLVVGVAVAAGVALLVAAAAATPGDYPDYNTAPRTIQMLDSGAFQDWAFAQVLSDVHTAAGLLTAAVVLLAPLAVSRWDRGVRLPVPAVLIGVVNTVLAGFVVTVNGWTPVVVFYMEGP